MQCSAVQYSELQSNIGPLVIEQQKVEEITATTNEIVLIETDDEVDESNKDKRIRNLKAELKKQGEGMKALEKLYNECEKLVKQLQEEKEQTKIVGKDMQEILQLKETEVAEADNESEDEGSERWKTVNKRQKSKKHTEKIIENNTEMECSICGQYVITDSELRAHIMNCHTDQENCNECDFQATTKPMLIKHKNLKHNSSGNQEDGAFECDHCDKQFSAQWNLKNHIRYDHESKTEMCTYFKQSRCSFSAKMCWKSQNHGNCFIDNESKEQ